MEIRMLNKRTYHIISKALNRKMKIVSYGHSGISLLLFPANTDDPLENEKFGLIEAMDQYLQKGRLRIFSIGSINQESWLNDEIPHLERSDMHRKYNDFIQDELVPFIFSITEGPTPMITTGAAIGAFHAANTYFRRPNLFYGTIALSGTYNIEHYAKGYFDENCYFNSPIHYLSNMDHPYWLSSLQSKHHVYILSGSGEDEFPENTIHLKNILTSKDIHCYSEIWSEEYGHNFDTWIKMLQHIFQTKL